MPWLTATLLSMHRPDGLVADQRRVGEGHGRIQNPRYRWRRRCRSCQCQRVAWLSVKVELLIVAVEGCSRHQIPRCFRWRRQHRKRNRHRWGVSTDRLVVDKRTVGHDEHRAPEIVDGSALRCRRRRWSVLPPPRAWLPVNVEEVTVAVPRFSRPPPKTSSPELAVAGLLTTAREVRVSVAPASLRIPPPPSSPTPVVGDCGEGQCRVRSVAWPSAIVRPAMVTVTSPLMSKTRLASLPLMVRRFAPGPDDVQALGDSSSPIVSVMV